MRSRSQGQPSQAKARATATSTALAGALGVCATRPNLRRTTAIALCVGACLVVINQLQALVGGPRSAGLWARVVLDFVVPFVVSNFGVLSGARRRRPVGVTGAAVDPAREPTNRCDPGRLDCAGPGFYAVVEPIDRGVDATPAGTREMST